MADPGKTEQFLCAGYRICGPRIVVRVIVEIIGVRFWFKGSKEFGTFQFIEKHRDLSWRKDAPDFKDESQQLGGKVGVFFGSLDEAEKLFSNEIVEGVVEPESFADVFGSDALFNPDLVKLYRGTAPDRGLSVRMRRTEGRPMRS